MKAVRDKKEAMILVRLTHTMKLEADELSAAAGQSLSSWVVALIAREIAANKAAKAETS